MSNSGSQQVDAGVGDLLLDQHPGQRIGEGALDRAHGCASASCSTIQSMQAVSASNVRGLDRWKYSRPQSISRPACDRADVDDPVRAQRRGH